MKKKSEKQSESPEVSLASSEQSMVVRICRRYTYIYSVEEKNAAVHGG